MTPERVVIDTNVLISDLFSTTSRPALAVEKALEGREVRRDRAPELHVRASRDPKDDKFLEAAVNGRANVLVSGDGDLLDLNPFRGIAIVTPADYVARES